MKSAQEDSNPNLGAVRSTSPLPPSKLRTRIMATGYKYSLLDPDRQLDLTYDATARPCLHNAKYLQRLVIALVATVVVLGVGLAVLATNGGDCNSSIELLPCTSPECVSTSATLMANMNPSVDPCQDLYHYACSGWLRRESVPPGSAKMDRFREVLNRNTNIIRELLEANGDLLSSKNSSAIRKAKIYYKTCLDEETVEAKGITGILQMINKLGSWTVSEANLTQWDPTSWTLQRSLVELQKLFTSPFLSVAIAKDDKDNSKKIVQFIQSGLTLSRESLYSGEDASKFKEAFLNFASRVAVLLGGDEKVATEKMTQVYDLEKKLAEIFVSRENLTDAQATYNKMTVREFQGIIGAWVNIEDYLTENFLGRATFTQDDEILVATPEYFRNLGPIIAETDKEVLANYMMWTLVSSFTAYLPEAFSKAAMELTKVETGVTTLPDRWRRCVSKVRGSLQMAVAALYVEKQFSNDSKTRVKLILSDIKTSFIDNLAHLPWLDDATRVKLQEKAQYISLMVGYPDWILDPSQLDQYYDKLTVESGEFLGNLISSIEYSRDRALDKFHLKPDKTEWLMGPEAVNAYYDPGFNIIVVPAGILQPPFFNPDYPDSVLYGTIGMIVGHELTHGFDNSGRYYDKHGNMVESMWSPQVEKSFISRSQCLIDQYSKYQVYGHKLNGQLTLGENIADNGGIKFAFDAFVKKMSPPSKLPAIGLTDKQLFFVGFSQVWCSKILKEYEIQLIDTNPHSTNQYRVIGVAQNSPEFSSAFACSKTSPMNPEHKCRVW